jgi:hypothetical protein
MRPSDPVEKAKMIKCSSQKFEKLQKKIGFSAIGKYP